VKYRYLVRQLLDQRDENSRFEVVRDVATTWAHGLKVSFAETNTYSSSVEVVTRNAEAEDSLQLEMAPPDPNKRFPEFPASELSLTLPTKEELKLLAEMDKAKVGQVAENASV
jgi:hypothetical protein